MKASDLRGKSVSELDNELGKLLEEQFKQNMQKATGQLAQTHVLKVNKRNIARIKTVMNEKVGK